MRNKNNLFESDDKLFLMKVKFWMKSSRVYNLDILVLNIQTSIKKNNMNVRQNYRNIILNF